MNKKLRQKSLDQSTYQQEIASHQAELNRARSVTVGTAFGGMTELSMRAIDGKTIWCIMQPVEVVELVHQLSANIGCHIAIKPRDDFSSWREWRVSDAEKKHLNGHAPHPNDISVFQRLGSVGFDQKQAEAAIEEWLSQKEYEYVNGAARIKKELKNETLAIKKSKNGRKLKRTSAAA